MNAVKSKSICVIGAGLSGLATMKELKQQGLRVTCFERRHGIGGVFSNEKTYDSVVLTISNYFMAFSDFMPVDERLKFWHKSEYLSYLERYADHFGVRSLIQFGTSVLGVERQNPGWRVRFQREGHEIESEYFDHVALCSGQFQIPDIPQFEGIECFQGLLLHSTQYNRPEEFRGKKVMCVGLGETSADVTSEIADHAEQTILGLRRYPIVAQRYLAVLDKTTYNVRYPLDVFTSSRALNTLPRDIHTQVTRNQFQQFKNSYDPTISLRGAWNLAAGPESQQVVTKNERVFDSIIDGKVQVNASGIDHLSEKHVHFKDGTQAEIDVIVFCTGFQFHIPFFDIPVKEGRELYKNMIYPPFGDSLGLIGFVRPQQGGVPPLAELQARYFALLCAGERTLPPQAELEAQAKKDHQRWLSEYCLTPHVNSLVNFVYFAEDVARLIGCEFQVDARKEPKLYQKCTEGPLWSVQYRLNGPGAIPERAREIILHKAPLPYRSSRLLRLLYRAMIWLRTVLPVGPAKKPRFA